MYSTELQTSALPQHRLFPFDARGRILDEGSPVLTPPISPHTPLLIGLRDHRARAQRPDSKPVTLRRARAPSCSRRRSYADGVRSLQQPSPGRREREREKAGFSAEHFYSSWPALIWRFPPGFSAIQLRSTLIGIRPWQRFRVYGWWKSGFVYEQFLFHDRYFPCFCIFSCSERWAKLNQSAAMASGSRSMEPVGFSKAS